MQEKAEKEIVVHGVCPRTDLPPGNLVVRSAQTTRSNQCRLLEVNEATLGALKFCDGGQPCKVPQNLNGPMSTVRCPMSPIRTVRCPMSPFRAVRNCVDVGLARLPAPRHSTEPTEKRKKEKRCGAPANSSAAVRCAGKLHERLFWLLCTALRSSGACCPSGTIVQNVQFPSNSPELVCSFCTNVKTC